jgi:TonB family protein
VAVKVLAFIAFLLFSVAIHASEALLIPVSTPKPEFPQNLLKKRHPGKVLVSLIVGAFGTVQSARVIESSHPQFTEAAQRAVVKWRYRPWEVAEGKPSSVEIAVPIIFGARGLHPFSPQITVGLENILCAYLNHEVHASKRDFPNEPLSKVDVFWHAQKYLAGSYTRSRVPDEAARTALFSTLEKAVPKIVKDCRNHPDRRMVGFLPKEIAELVVGGS